MMGSCECSNEPSGPIKCTGNFLTEDLLASQEGLYSMELLAYQLLNKMLYIIKLQGTQWV